MANLLKELVVHECASGGLLYEFVRDEAFGQLAVRTVLPGTTVGKHKHSTDEWWLVVEGEGVVRLEYPDNIRVLHNVSGKIPQILHLPAWTGHEISNTAADGDLIFIFWSAELYDPDTHVKEPWEW